MANLLDEVTGPVNEDGRDVNVISRQIPVTVTFKSTLFEIHCGLQYLRWCYCM